jgi:hypothetical protein
MSYINEVKTCIEIWVKNIKRKYPDVEKMSEATFEELAAYENCLELIEEIYGFEITEKITH